MKRNKLALYIHLIWATWDRQPLLTPDIERRVHRNIASQAIKMKCKLLAINGMPDHVHLFVRIPSTITIANLVKQVKGVSSHFVNDTIQPGFHFKWQGFYGAFSVSRWDIEKIINYVRRQKKHHRFNDLYPEWEETYVHVES